MKSKYLLVMPLTLGTLLLGINVSSINSKLISNAITSVESTPLASFDLMPEEQFIEVEAKAETINIDPIESETNNVKSMRTLESKVPEVVVQPITAKTTALVEEVVSSNIVLVDSVKMKDLCGSTVKTDKVQIDTDALMELYGDVSKSPAWDVKEKIDIVESLWEFLVNQNGMSKVNAAALIGNIIAEGKFAEQQGTGLVISNIGQARKLLGSGKMGYGIVQWTYHSRQKALLEYYELAHMLYPNDWDRVKVTAECAMLLEEVKVYKVFDDIKVGASIEDATGRVCMKYESYRGCEKQWSRRNGAYKLVSGKGSNGYERLSYAKSVYEYFSD